MISVTYWVVPKGPAMLLTKKQLNIKLITSDEEGQATLRSECFLSLDTPYYEEHFTKKWKNILLSLKTLGGSRMFFHFFDYQPSFSQYRTIVTYIFSSSVLSFTASLSLIRIETNSICSLRCVSVLARNKRRWFPSFHFIIQSIWLILLGSFSVLP